LLEVKVNRSLPDFQLDIDLTVDREILSILGPSGSGKTMTLLCIAGLVRPDQGSIRLNGRILYSSKEGIFLPPQKRKIGFVFQN
jgi:molybdate transport system ATP-binding protein